MGLIDRVKNIVVTPKTEWDVIAAEPTPPAQIVTGYVLPLAAVAAVAGFIGLVLVGTSLGPLGTYRLSMTAGLANLVYTVVMAVVAVFLLGFIIDALAPTFGAQKNFNQAIKVIAYSYTPVWVMSVVTIIPLLGILVVVAAIYGVYLLYLGLPRLMKCPPEKAAGYTAVVIVVAIVIGIVIGAISAAFMSIGAPSAASLRTSGSSGVTFDKDSPMGKLDAFSKKMEEQGKRMEEAKKSGDPQKEMAAAMATLGVAMSGGKGVEPVQSDALKPFVPEQFAGLPRTDMRTERSGVAGLMVAKAEATYRNEGKRVRLEVLDTGGAAGLMGLATWMGVRGEREDASHRESTRTEGNRTVHETVSKTGGANKYAVIVGDRFVVSADGRGVDIDTLRSGVNAVDLGKLEALK
jgi:hypothetical protein